MISFRKIVFLLLGIFLNISAHAAIIYNSTNPTDQTIALGINPEGHLNTTAPANIVVNSGSTGIARKISGVWRDATSPGCWCEGWGVSGTVVNTDGTTQTVTGYADVSVVAFIIYKSKVLLRIRLAFHLQYGLKTRVEMLF